MIEKVLGQSRLGLNYAPPLSEKQMCILLGSACYSHASLHSVIWDVM